MNTKPYLWAMLLLALGCSGGDDGGVAPPENRSPNITVDFSKIGVARNTSTQISASVSDPDGDPLTITWTATRGTITSLNGANTLVQWSVPATVGVDSITAQVSDGTASKSAKIGIKVGTSFSGGPARTVFLKSQSPYIVSVSGAPPVLVVTDVATTIEAGTELLIETPNSVIDISDSLLAVGAPGDEIVIRPNLRNLTCGDDRGWWQGLKVTSDLEAGHAELNYVQIWYARWAVRLRDSGSATIRNSALRCSSESGVLHEGGGALIVEDTQITDGELDGITLDTGTFSPDEIEITGCLLKQNSRYGVWANLDDQAGSIPFTIEASNFEFNGQNAIRMSGASNPLIHFNRFDGNGIGQGLIDIYLENGFPIGENFTTISATCNFWGAAMASATPIEARIRDSGDTANIVADVVVTPWSNQNPYPNPGASTCVLP